MIARQEQTYDYTTTHGWQRPARPGREDSRPPPDLSRLERSISHLGSDYQGLAVVIIGCTKALLAVLLRIERRLES